jgi:hypothetical protein
MRLKFIFLLIFLFFSFGCRKVNDDGYRVYTIKEGKHRSTFNYNTSRSQNFTWSIIFDSSAIYTTDDPDNQYDINKLNGLFYKIWLEMVK